MTIRDCQGAPQPAGSAPDTDSRPATTTLIRRPVPASVVSLVIFILRVRAFVDLQVRQYPEAKDIRQAPGP